ncbi:MAG: DUF1015 family protein [Bacteroidota bacterium]
MAILHPFRALRPVPAKASEVACVPYDVINTKEARQLAAGKPLSFLHVIRPEIDLDAGVDIHADAVYAKGAANLTAYRNSHHAIQEARPALYVYRLIMDGRSQTGVYGCVAVSDYDSNVILKHEKTRPDKEADRTKHIVTQQAHAEPVMVTFRDHGAVQEIIEETQASEPLYNFKAPDGVQHTIWRVAETDELVDAFDELEELYIADGHHRCKAASLAADTLAEGNRVGAERNFFPAVLFPMSEMAILAYNRIVYKLPKGPAAFLDAVRDSLGLTETATPVPAAPGTICLYVDEKWYSTSLPETKRGSVADTLDVARLGEHLLEPLLDIHDPRTDPNMYFVGGIRGTDELERLVDGGEAALAISMYPTSIEELLDVSDAGLLMPPKSTWFEPKLRSGLLVHLMD